MKYYVEKYEKYPIHENAEGGYYYSGCTLLEGWVYNSRRSAQKKQKQWGKELGWNAKINGNNVVFGDDDYYNSKYIGEGSFIRVSRQFGYHRSGYHSYE